MKTPNDKKRPNSGMSLAKFKRSREHLAHLSAPLLDHPLWLHAAKIGRLSTYDGPRYEVGRGTTFKAQRNAMKRVRRKVKIDVAGSVRAFQRRFTSMGVSRVASA